VKKILHTPVTAADLEGIKVGDVIYLSGHIVTCRDVAHRRLIEYGRELPIDIDGGAIFHAGPIVRKVDEDQYEMVAIGPTTSMRMEKFEKEFIRQTGVKVIVGKGGMGQGTVEGCRQYKAIHCVFPAGCAVLAATQVEEIEGQEWMDLGMPETLWLCRVEEFGPLVVSIDTYGNNLFEANKVEFNRRKDEQIEKISKEVRFIK
jgi:L(+)-tartrate dehydratase beta subunit